MRVLLRATIPVESGNAAALDGSLGTTIQKWIEKFKPEAAYFVAIDGCRTGLFFVNIEGEWQIPVMSEPWFIGLNAKIELLPAMNAQDVARGLTEMAKSAGA